MASIVLASFAFAVAAGAGAMDAVASGEGPVSVEVNDGLPWFNFGVSPKLLSLTEPSPAQLVLGFDFESGGFRPPPLSPVSVELDKGIALEPTGIPICGGFGIQGGVEPAKDCKESIVGHGKESFAIDFPEQKPQQVSGPVVVYYGGRHNSLIKLHAIASLGNPIRGSLDIEIDLKPIGGGRLGTEASFSVPRVAADAGAIADLELSLFKRFVDRGQRRSFVSAACRDGRLEAIASALQSPSSDSESPLEESDVRTCTPKR